MASTLNEFLEKALKEDKVNEASVFPEKVIQQMQKFTDENDHSAARVLAAKTIRNKKMMEAYEGMEKIVQFLGHMPQELSTVRYEIDKRLFHTLKTKYSNGQNAYMAM